MPEIQKIERQTLEKKLVALEQHCQLQVLLAPAPASALLALTIFSSPPLLPT